MMKSRKGTPDIMSNLMNGSISTCMNELENNKAIKPENNKAINKVSKEKITFNLSSETLQILEESWIHLRRKLKGEKRVTKTLIVEKALEIIFADLESKNELSDLYIQLKQEKKLK